MLITRSRSLVVDQTPILIYASSAATIMSYVSIIAIVA